jgi:signal peptidase I
MVVFNTEAPFVVVLTGSMEPSYFRGDILAVTNNQDVFNVGDIVVYRFHVEDIPIVHRVISSQIE